ncbi:MAG TPA: hypothetical protein VGF24_26135 [Vicinamibacterales bacterium]|jgi:hypothetical protein
MLSDRDIEDVLRRYRVVDPPSGLGSAIDAAIDASGRFEWIWGPAAAIGILAAWIGLQAGSVDTHSDPNRASEIAVVTEMLGGDEYAAARAELIVPRTTQLDPLVALAEDRWQTN